MAAPAAAQTADRLYVMDCGHNSAKDQSRWSPGVNVGKPIEMSDMCVLVKHREQWLLWDTGYPDAIADQPVDTPVGRKEARPNHIGIAIARHKRAGRIEERDGKLYATHSTGTERHAVV
jgi:hypothetical protein